MVQLEDLCCLRTRPLGVHPAHRSKIAEPQVSWMTTQVGAPKSWLHPIAPDLPALGKGGVQARASDPGTSGTVAEWALGQGARKEPPWLYWRHAHVAS